MMGKMGNEMVKLDEDEKIIAKVDAMLQHNDKSDKPLNTIDNFTIILSNDKNLFSHIQYNLFSYRAEYIEYDDNDNVINVSQWSDTNDAMFMSYIEKNYNLYDDKKYRQAFRIVSEKHGYHPIKDLIENKKWDGVERIDNFLKDILKCRGDENYLREVSRMLFYGGISRVYEPGVKFDYMFVLSGKQGIGKSTIVSWLALHHNNYREVTTIKDKEGIECIMGGWMCEFSELMAFRNRSTSEAIKAFITRQVDRCRLSYGYNISSFPRSCIFIGTTNETDYLTDETGNRRFLPLYMQLEVGELYDKEDYIKDYILNCWREALYLYENGKTYLTIPKKYSSLVEHYREETSVEDIKLQSLENYLDEKEIGYRICAKEIATKVFKKLETNINKGDSTLISKYMSRQDNWVRKPPTDLPEYGNQRYWIKVSASDRELKRILEKKKESDLE